MTSSPSPNLPAVDGASFSRRSFLAAGAAGAAALAAVAPAQSSGQSVVAEPPKTPAPKGTPPVPVKDGEPIKIGVIGTGGMGTGHCQALIGLAKAGKCNAEIVAVADVNDINAGNAKAICEREQGGRTVESYRDYTKLLGRDDIRAVVIATPEHWHAKTAADAILAGKHVYLEKPMTLDLPDALFLRSVALANPGVVLQIGTQMTQLPKYKVAREMIRNGEIGVPVWSQTSYCRNSKSGEWTYYALDPNRKPGENLDWEAWCGPSGKAAWSDEVYARWRRFRKYSSGIIGDLLVHVMTPMMYAVDQGWPVHVTATASHMVDKTMENPDQINLTIQFETGHIMIVAGSTANEVGLEKLIRGHKGNLYLESRHCEFRPERIFVDDGLDAKRVDCPDIGNDQDVHRLAFLESIRTGEKPIADIDLSTKVMVVVDLATRSSWDGAAYRFDPKTLTAYRV